MAFVEDSTTLTAYLNDFGVSCTTGGSFVEISLQKT